MPRAAERREAEGDGLEIPLRCRVGDLKAQPAVPIAPLTARAGD